jgi:hypothetical protein
VQDIVNAHKADPRVVFWETFNEPNKSPETQRLMEAALGWIHETGTTIPVTATGGSFSGGPYSDYLHSLCTECMQRRTASLPAVVAHMGGRVGFTVWELGIGRDNCRFDWDDNAKHPARNEPAVPFHGVVYPDGHPWSIDDVKSLMGPAAFDRAPVFDVRYYRDDHFTDLAKASITPMIDFDVTDEPGAGSPDASAGIPNDHFSVLWTGMLLPPARGSYTFFADCDNQVKVSVDGKPVLDKETPGRSEVSHAIDLAGQRPCAMRVEYRHFAGNSSLHLSWSGPGMDKRIILPVKGP